MAWSEGRRPLGAVLHSSNELSELSQWTCGHDDKHYKYRPGYYITFFNLPRPATATAAATATA